MTPTRRVLALAALALAALASPAAAQFGMFGPNKVQYRQFEWRTLRGEHVDLYFYPEEDELARVALTYAEESYRELEAVFRHPVTARIPFFVYASHADFEQTNLLPFVPPEGLLGFTEFARSRVVLPFRGNYAEFRHTIRHELVHVFQLSRARLTSALYPRVRRIELPLWFSEGLAEYWSGGEDTQDDMILRDLTQGGRLPTIEQLGYAGGGIVYAIGGTLVRHLAETYGEWRLVQLYDDIWKYDDLDQLLTGVFGRTPGQLTAEWHHAMRRRYYPLVTEQRPLALDARRLARQAIKPAVWVPPEDTAHPLVVYLSPRSGYTDVYAVPLAGGREETLVQGERSPQFESFHAFDSRIDVSREGILAFASKFMDRDALVLWDLRARRMVGRYQFPDLVSILSPAFAPDARRVVFSGLTFSGYSDLYILDLETGALDRLTADRYQDLDPSFSPDGTRIVFASDRTPSGPDGGMNLFVLDAASRSIRYLTYGPWADRGPRWTPEERIIFTSDRRGVQDIYQVDSTGAGRRETGVPGGAFDPVWVPESQRYVFGGFEGLEFGIYAMSPTPDAPATDSVVLDSAAVTVVAAADSVSLDTAAGDPGWRWGELEDGRYARTEPARFDRRFNLELAAADAAIIPGVAGRQGAVFLLSDLLADHLLFFSVAFYQQSGGLKSFLSDINGTAVYLNQSRRLNWGVGVFRVSGRFYEGSFDRVYEETAGGGFFLLRYPLSRFTRVEARWQIEHSDRLDYTFSAGGDLGFPQRRGILTSQFLSYVWDNSLWLATGPIDGSRVSLTGGLVTDLRNARFDSWQFVADARRYVRLAQQSALALRGFTFLSGGERPDRVAIGGSLALRGYPRFSYVAGTKAVLANTEWRFPITDYLTFGFPFGEWRFPGIQGALFVDVGRAWFTTASERGWLGSYGLGGRMSLGFPFVLRLDLGWRFGDLEGAYQLPRNYRHNRFADFWIGINY